MNKKDYTEEVNEIKSSNELKIKALKKVAKKRTYRKVYAFASLLVVMVISISILVPMQNKIKEIKTDPIQIIESNSGLPKVENFNNLYQIMKEKNENEYYFYSLGVESMDSVTNGALKEDVTDSATDYSKTNVQVDGVDEADIVKTDGNYIYYVGLDKVNIIDASNSGNLKKVKEIIYEHSENENFYPQEVYINGDKLIVIGNKSVSEENSEMDKLHYSSTYKGYTVAKVYNVENKKNIKLEREIELEGNYLSSRMIGENIYLLSNKYLYSYLFRDKAIEELDENEFKPQYIDTAVSESIQNIEYDCICYLPESNDATYLNIAGFNINNSEPANIDSYLGAGTEIYASENNLYVTMLKYEYKDTKSYGFYNNVDINTYIYKFELSDGKIIYKSVGNVPGEILNQFSMDENNGYFRIATTDRENWNEETNRNNMYVLDSELNLVGKIEDLARGEKIYSVRFMGDRAYMVTFVQTDPLFVIDLSEPKNPNVLGELKIPGYSKYLHPYDETHIIGFGEDTKVVNYGYGDAVTTDGMKMALFDVTDPTNPTELYSLKIGEKGTYSELLYNHKVLLFSKEKNIIAFPISITEEDYQVTFQGAIVYGLDLENGFNFKGKIAHFDINEETYNYNKSVERIIYIEDTLFTLSEELVKATDMNTMEEQDKLEI